MKCEAAQQSIVLVTYGELPDEEVASLEQHLAACEACNRELKAMLAMHEALAYPPMVEPSPNLVAQSRMRLDEELDTMPPHGWITRLRSNFYGWMGHLQSAPALMTLLVGVGFLAGNFASKYQVAHEPRKQQPLTVTQAAGAITNITGIVQTPNTEMVQVSYNRVVPETMQGSLDDAAIRQLLVIGTKAAATDGVRTDSVGLLADECRARHQCGAGVDSIRDGLLVSLRYDRSPVVRMRALEGLQGYVAQDQRVRDAMLEALMHDSSATVRTRAISLLEPVQSDSSVRRVMRTVSTTDENPYIRTVSTHALKAPRRFSRTALKEEAREAMKKALALGLMALAAGTGTAMAGGTPQAGEGVFFSFSAANGPAHGAAQGYLGVDLRDVSEERVAVLKLKETRGAEITLVDRDAPAGKAGLREHDVVLQMNGQAVEGEEQVRKLLRECAPGATVVLTISRDGQQMTKTAQMANRSDVEREAWERRIIVPEPQETPLSDNATGPGFAGGAAGPAVRGGNSFMGTILMNPAYTGAVLGRMTSQLAQFFGVANGTGLLVQGVAMNSPAAQAGMRVGDVVVRADARAVTNTSDWTKAIKNSHGRPLSVVVLRDKREQTLTLVPDGKKRSSLEQQDSDGPVVARLGFSWMPEVRIVGGR